MDTYKTCKIGMGAIVGFLVGESRDHNGVFGWRLGSGLVYASYLKSGTRSSGLAK